MSQTKAQLLDNIKDNVQLDARNALRFADTDSSHYVAFKAPATVSSNVTWTLPAADGSANYVLATDGSGTLSWIADPAGQWVTSSSDIYFTGGNVGIGDSSPSNPLSVTGVSAFNGDVTLTGASYSAVWDKSDNALEFADNAKAVFGAQSDLQIYHQGTYSMISSQTGNLYIEAKSGETAIQIVPDGAVDLRYNSSQRVITNNNGAEIKGATDTTLTVEGGTDGYAQLFLNASGSASVNYLQSDQHLIFWINSAERLRMDTSGRLIIGATGTNSVGGFGGAALQVEGLDAATSAMSLIRHSNDAVGSTILMAKTRGTADGATTVVQSGDAVARIIAYGGDGTDTQSSVGAIQFDVDGTPGSNDMPGRIVFSTTADGAATYTERLRINSAGQVLIGGTTSAEGTNNGFEVFQTWGGRIGLSRNDTVTAAGNNLGMISFYGNDANGAYQLSALIAASADLDHDTGDKPGRLEFHTTPDGSTTPSERLRINSSGQLLCGVTGNAGAADANAVFGGGTAGTGNYGKIYITQNQSNPTANTAIGFVGFSTQDVDNAPYAFMGVYADGNHGTNDYPSRFSFFTTPDGTNSTTERMRIHSGGIVSIPNGIELGSALDATDANTLDDYEEGTFNPQITQGISANSYSQQHGRYTKIGNKVHLDMYLRINDADSTGAAYVIGNFPFTINNSGYVRGGGCTTFWSLSTGASGSGTVAALYGSGGGTTAQLYQGSTFTAGTNGAAQDSNYLICFFEYMT